MFCACHQPTTQFLIVKARMRRESVRNTDSFAISYGMNRQAGRASVILYFCVLYLRDLDYRAVLGWMTGARKMVLEQFPFWELLDRGRLWRTEMGVLKTCQTSARKVCLGQYSLTASPASSNC